MNQGQTIAPQNRLVFAPCAATARTTITALSHTCVFVLAASLMLTTQHPVHAATPSCSSALADADGDGWGWENNNSCLVIADSASDSASPPNAEVPASPAAPGFCVDPASDPDGDGYGWEQNASCIVQTGNGQPGTEQTGNSAEPTTAPGNPDQSAAAPAVCVSADSDPDGDGYGWENQQSCLVSSQTPPTVSAEPQAPASDDDSGSQDNPAPQTPTAPATALRFMAVGDSITHGVSKNSAKSYRQPLTASLNAAGCSYTMVGSQQTNLGHSSFVSPHEGYNGHRVDHFLTGLNNYAGNNEGVAVNINRFAPDLVLLHLGTNDMIQAQGVADTLAEIDQVISIILDSGAEVLVANVIPVFGYGAQDRVKQLGDQLNSYVAQLADARVRLVDVRSGFTQSMMLSDNLHPNSTGEAHIARAFFNAIKSANRCLTN